MRHNKEQALQNAPVFRVILPAALPHLHRQRQSGDQRIQAVAQVVPDKGFVRDVIIKQFKNSAILQIVITAAHLRHGVDAFGGKRKDAAVGVAQIGVHGTLAPVPGPFPPYDAEGPFVGFAFGHVRAFPGQDHFKVVLAGKRQDAGTAHVVFTLHKINLQFIVAADGQNRIREAFRRLAFAVIY